MAYRDRVDHFWAYTDEPVTGKPSEEGTSDKRRDMTPSPNPDKSSDAGLEKSREKFELLLEERMVPQQVAGQVYNDESLRHSLNRSPFNSNGEIVMVRYSS